MYSPDTYLVHFGIFGQKWGVRRYQNEDGTLTEEGKKRYNSRVRDVGAAKEHVLTEIENDKKSRDFFIKEAESIKKIPRNKSSVKKNMRLSEEDYKDAISQFGSIEKYLQYEEQYYRHDAKVHANRISDFNEKMKKLNALKVDAIMSDKEHMKQIEDIFTQSKGWLMRYVDLHGVRGYISYVRKHPEHKLVTVPAQKDSPKKKTLTQRFHDAQRDNPKLTYDQIYKEMKVNMESDDPDDYKDAEDRWFKKHGY